MAAILKKYVFNKTARTITFSDFPSILLQDIGEIVNVTRNIVIYDPLDVSKGSTSLVENVLTLAFDTSTHADTDALRIVYGDSYAEKIAAGGVGDIRTTATSIAQTINANGSVTQIVYTFPTGIITDSFTYGANSFTEPTTVSRGAFVPTGAPASATSYTQVLSAASGSTPPPLTITYAPVGGNWSSGVVLTPSVSGITGTFNPVTLSPTGSGSIQSVFTPSSVGVGSLAVTNSGALTNPATATYINNAIGLTKQTLAFSAGAGITITGDTVAIAGAGQGTRSSLAINSANAFEVIVSLTSEALSSTLVTVLGTTDVANYAWNGGNTYLIGAYTTLSELFRTTVGGAATSFVASTAFPVKIKYRKSGADIILSTSTDGGTVYTDRHTVVGALTGNPTLYLRVFNALTPNQQVNIELFL